MSSGDQSNFKQSFLLSRPHRLIHPEPVNEERIVVPMPDFADLKTMIGEMGDPLLSWSNWVTTFIGTAVGAFIAWLLMDDKHKASAIVVAAIWIGAVILAGFMGWVGFHIRERQGTQKKHLQRTMSRLEDTCPRLSPKEEPAE